ncbi:hypothetical protein T492DRAFT_1090591 [Pavlovales sp. CCMP2436]|nr:hypothetical protein T492DRAFT_1090591 [Pavlovales sp. CCMP2436]
MGPIISAALWCATLALCWDLSEGSGTEGRSVAARRALGEQLHPGWRLACGPAHAQRLRGGFGRRGSDELDGPNDEPDDEPDDEAEMEEATRLKALGNECVKEGDYAGAAARYAAAIHELGYDGTGSAQAAELDRRCRLNLASCAIKIGDFDEAIGQCTEVLSHFPSCPKALGKRAQARESTGSLVEAVEDYRSASRLASPAERAQLSERADLLEQLAAGGDGFADPFGGMGDMASMFGMGGPGGLGGLAALADSGLLPPGLKRLLAVAQFVMGVRTQVKRVLVLLEPAKPLLLAALLLLPALRFLWLRLAPFLFGPDLQVAAARHALELAAESARRVQEYVLLVVALLHARRLARA